MAAVPGFKFELTHPSGTTELPGGLFLTRADGAVLSANRLQVNAEANFGRVFIRVRAVVIDGETYMTNFLTGSWGKVDAANSPFAFLDPVGLVASLLGEVTGPSFESARPGGGDYVVLGRISAVPLAQLVGTVDETKTVSVRLTIDAQTFLLEEVAVDGPLQAGDGEGASRLIRLSGFDSEITIEPPVLGAR
jgi:hypothetical protein